MPEVPPPMPEVPPPMPKVYRHNLGRGPLMPQTARLARSLALPCRPLARVDHSGMKQSTALLRGSRSVFQPSARQFLTMPTGRPSAQRVAAGAADVRGRAAGRVDPLGAGADLSDADGKLLGGCSAIWSLNLHAQVPTKMYCGWQ
jgi:hypothetical protein